MYLDDLEKKAFFYHVLKEGSENGTVNSNSLKVFGLWEEKKEKLLKLFNNELIMSFDIPTDFSYNFNFEVKEEMRTILANNDSFFRKIKSQIETIKFLAKEGYSMGNGFHILTNIFYNEENWLSNSIDGLLCNNCSLYINENIKPIKIYKNTKITTLISKLADLFECKPEYEKLRLKHSEIVQKLKKIDKVYVSIHPLDFATLSDNANNWSSCLSIDETGCYRAGIGELLTSPTSIVAYTVDDNKKYTIGNFSWNSKTWRQLFYLEEACILSSIGYPRRNERLSQFILEKLRKLAKDRLGYSYDEGYYSRGCGDFHANLIHKNGTEEEIRFDSNVERMYDDLNRSSSSQNLFFIINKEKLLKENYSNMQPPVHTIEMSGEAICLNCGNSILYNGGESHLCDECYEEVYSYCVDCGEAIYDENSIYYYEDAPYCEHCFNDRFISCAFCGEIFRRDCSLDIALQYHATNWFAIGEREKGSLYEEFICSDCVSDSYDGINSLTVIKIREGVYFDVASLFTGLGALFGQNRPFTEHLKTIKLRMYRSYEILEEDFLYEDKELLSAEVIKNTIKRFPNQQVDLITSELTFK